MQKFHAILTISLLLFLHPAWSIENNDLLRLIDLYKSKTSQLEVPAVKLGYLENLNNIKDLESRKIQLEEFTLLNSALTDIDRSRLTEDDQYVFDHLRYRIELNFHRLMLENKYKEVEKNRITSTLGIYNQPFGKEWYLYFLRHWLSVDRTPEWLIRFGGQEVEKVQAQLDEIIKDAGYEGREIEFYRHLQDQNYFLSDENSVVEIYREKEAVVRKNLSKMFFFEGFPEYSIEPWPQPNKDTPPARVVVSPNNIFQFSFYQERHNRQDMGFLYLHEAVPGHLYAIQYDLESNYDSGLNLPAYAYHGFSEGWGAYVEELGGELGLYATPYDLVGKLRFDLVRSARVVLDVGINYFGWDNDKALTYWCSTIVGQDDIAQREIDRVRRWPGQAISYKVGAKLFLTLKAKAKDVLGDEFDIREFHHQILGFGSVSLFLVEQRVNDYISEKIQ